MLLLQHVVHYCCYYTQQKQSWLRLIMCGKLFLISNHKQQQGEQCLSSISILPPCVFPDFDFNQGICEALSFMKIFRCGFLASSLINFRGSVVSKTKIFSSVSVMSTFASSNNFLLADWDASTEFGLPPFSQIQPKDFEPAFKVAMETHMSDLKAIVDETQEPSFDNTIAKFDRAGRLFEKVHLTFDNLCGSYGVPELQMVETKMAAPLAVHSNKVYTYPGLFQKIDVVYEERLKSGFTAEQIRLTERIHLDFVRSGAKFDHITQKRYAAITEEMATLETRFAQNVMADESEITLPLAEDERDGLPDDLLAAAQQAASERYADTNKADANNPTHVITLSRSLVEPFLTFSTRRDLREKAWRLWTNRGELDANRDNKAIATKILQLRLEQAQLHGYNTYADYATADTMAGSPDKVLELLERVWPSAKSSLERERAALTAYVATNCSAAELPGGNLEPWDWRFYAEKVRQTQYNIDDSEVKPYFKLENMVEAIFDCANKLFGLRFVPRPDLTSYHPDVKTYEVRETVEGVDTLVAIFLHDNYARPYKRSGAWMSELRSQTRNTIANANACAMKGDTATSASNMEEGERVVPIIMNNNNFNKPSAGAPTLLSYDDAVTLFHEFGHGMHGALSSVTYSRLAGTNVLRDFVELPSQLFEHWLGEKEVLKAHARHYQTNEPIPDELLARLMNARSFQQGFNAVEYTASALVDTALHMVTGDALAHLDMSAFEKQELARLNMPSGMIMRHRPAHFQHLFSCSGYASAYYVYLWAEVLDADGFEAFLEAGSCFDPETASRVRRFIYSAGNSQDPAALYKAFRGREPSINAMLKKKGFIN